MFHITVTEKETDTVLVDFDSNCVIGATDENGDGVGVMSFTSCNLMKITETISGACKAISATLQNPPVQRALVEAAVTAELKMGEKKEK